MTTYNIVNEGNQIWVTWKSDGMGLPYRNGPYRNEDSAKRRIRDLKRKDAPKNLELSSDKPTTIAPVIPATINRAPVSSAVPQVGVYPAVRKRAYRR